MTDVSPPLLTRCPHCQGSRRKAIALSGRLFHGFVECGGCGAWYGTGSLQQSYWLVQPRILTPVPDNHPVFWFDLYGTSSEGVFHRCGWFDKQTRMTIQNMCP